MKKRLVAAVMLCLCIACNNSPHWEQASETATSQSTTANKRIRNSIELHTGSIIVSEAYLVYGDDGTLLPADNAITMGRPVQLKLTIARGWKEDHGKVALGAEEKIITSDGQLIFATGDMFLNTPVINVHDAHAITLTATVTANDRLTKHLVVVFRIWDKKGSGVINGSYPLWMK